MKVKATHHIGVRTPNKAELVKFYSETLGLPVVREWPEANISFIDIGSTTIELIGRDDATTATETTGGVHHIALHVEDVDEAFQELVEKGVRIRSEPRSVFDVRVAFFYDPDGNILELCEDPRKEGK